MSHPFKIAGLEFTLATNTLRGNRLRRDILRRFADYLRFHEFPTVTDLQQFQSTHDPYYIDIFGATTAINDDPDHPLLITGRMNVEVWDEYLRENETLDTDAELYIAAAEARRLNPQWYLTFSPERDTTAEKINNYLENHNPEHDPDEPMPEEPSESELLDDINAKVERVVQEREAQNKPFLRRKKSSRSRKTVPTARAASRS